MKIVSSVAAAFLVTTGATAQIAGGAPSQITGIPPVQFQNQIYDQSGRSYYEPHASGQPVLYPGGRTAEFRAKYAAYEVRKAARKAARAAAKPS